MSKFILIEVDNTLDYQGLAEQVEQVAEMVNDCFIHGIAPIKFEIIQTDHQEIQDAVNAIKQNDK